jgi:F-type H+-transporting ATPase subunit alpha
MKTEEQVCVLYSGVRGYLDKLKTSEIGKFEEMFLEHIRSKHGHILEEIRTKKELTDVLDNELKTILEDFIPNSGLEMKV